MCISLRFELICAADAHCVYNLSWLSLRVGRLLTEPWLKTSWIVIANDFEISSKRICSRMNIALLIFYVSIILYTRKRFYQTITGCVCFCFEFWCTPTWFDVSQPKDVLCYLVNICNRLIYFLFISKLSRNVVFYLEVGVVVYIPNEEVQ